MKHPFKPTRCPTTSELEDSAKLDRFLSQHKRLKPPPYEFGPLISRRVVFTDFKPLLSYPE